MFHLFYLNSYNYHGVLLQFILSFFSALSQELKAKVDYKPTETDGNKTSKCNSDLWDGETRHNMTLVGGIGAGDFTDHGQTDSIEECMGYCCENKECDLAFMIDKDCYGVKCKEPSMCKTRPARPTKYRPIIAFKKSSESGMKNIFCLCLIIEGLKFF